MKFMSMKVNRLESHDRLQHLVKQEFDIGKTCQDIVNQRPFGEHAFYIFTHKRQIGMDERISMLQEDMWKAQSDPYYKIKYKALDEVPTDRMIWQPRLTKPEAQTNSMLFKGYPGTDNVKVIWIIPDPCLWPQYEKGKMTESQVVWESIQAFKSNPMKLSERESDDYSDSSIAMIYGEISRAAQGFKKL